MQDPEALAPRIQVHEQLLAARVEVRVIQKAIARQTVLAAHEIHGDLRGTRPSSGARDGGPSEVLRHHLGKGNRTLTDAQ